MLKRVLLFLLLTSFCTAIFSQSNSGSKKNRFRTFWINKSERADEYELERMFRHNTSFIIESQTITIESEDSTIGQKVIHYKAKDLVATNDDKIVTISGNVKGEKEEYILVTHYSGKGNARKIFYVVMYLGDIKYKFYNLSGGVVYY